MKDALQRQIDAWAVEEAKLAARMDRADELELEANELLVEAGSIRLSVQEPLEAVWMQIRAAKELMAAMDLANSGRAQIPEAEMAAYEDLEEAHATGHVDKAGFEAGKAAIKETAKPAKSSVLSLRTLGRSVIQRYNPGSHKPVSRVVSGLIAYLRDAGYAGNVQFTAADIRYVLHSVHGIQATHGAVRQAMYDLLDSCKVERVGHVKTGHGGRPTAVYLIVR